MAAVLRAESDDPGRRGAAIVCTAALDVLTNTPGLPDPHFGDALDGALDRLPLRDRMAVPYTFRRGLLPESGAAELLAECGAIDPTTRTVTPLGIWARPEFDRPQLPRLPGPTTTRSSYGSTSNPAARPRRRRRQRDTA